MTSLSYGIALYFLLFLFYSVGGWCVEVIYCMIVDTSKNGRLTITNRGFLNGPLCPIYGFAAVSMALTLQSLTDRLIPLFLVGVLVCDAVEYTTSYVMEKIFHARWWDYSKDFLNINGRISFKHSVMWGFLSVVFMNFINPAVLELFEIFDERQIKLLATAALFLFIYDLVTTLITTINVVALQQKLHTVKRAFSVAATGSGTASDADSAKGNRLERDKIPGYALDFQNKLREYSVGRKHSRMMHLLHEYPEIVRLMRDEIDEMQSVPHEFKKELVFLQMELDTFVNSKKNEMY